MSSTSAAVHADPAAIDAFIAYWSETAGSERANYSPFLHALCTLLDVPAPDASTGIASRDNYVIDKPVTFRHGDGSTSTGFIDLYKRGCFVCETKQGVEQKRARSAAEALAAGEHPEEPRRRGHGVRGSKGWDDAMLAARGQAEGYVRALPDDNPPFVVVMDVGYSIELYADFSRLGKVYTPFPDAQSHRLRLDQLKDPAIFARLRALWLDPLSLDPSRQSAEATRKIAEQLAILSQSLERQGHHPEQAAQFLMRCLFTAFAEDVELLPKGRFTELLKELESDADRFPHEMRGIWHAMDKGDYSPSLKKKLLKFNGGLFADADALPLNGSQIHILYEAADRDWKHVEPAIFGTLLERALNVDERHKLGAHFTPRAYVERLVLPTIIEPLREELDAARTAALAIANRPVPADIHPGTKLYDNYVAKQNREARAEVYAFLKRLCEVKVLDPACGTGNFLYVSMAKMKDLEGEANDLLRQLGDDQYAAERQGLTVDPHQFLGIEINPRAVAIAELVLWIGYLQWHFRTHGNTAPAEPVLKDFDNIRQGDAVLAYDRKELVLDEHGKPVTRWDGKTTKRHPVTGEEVPDESARVPVYRYVNPRKAEWPKADFVVGNPPFIGDKKMNLTLSDEYVTALRTSRADLPDSADFVMYWWDTAADAARRGLVRRFGLITTNAIRHTFNRRVVEYHLAASPPLSVVWAIPDHPWVDCADGAAVRIAMTVGTGGHFATGALVNVISEEPTDDGDAVVQLDSTAGTVHADLSVGAKVSAVMALQSNLRICNVGFALHAEALSLTTIDAEKLRADAVRHGVERPETYIRPIYNGRDMAQRPRGAHVLDLYGIDERSLSKLGPIHQWVLDRVWPERKHNKRDSYRRNWWILGEPRPELRDSLHGIGRYIATAMVAVHRIFQFVAADVAPDQKLVCVASDDSFLLGALSSRVHCTWALRAGSTLEDRPSYSKTRCFDPFPFPTPTDAQKARIRELGEQLDAHRKRQQAAHPALTITDMYNVLEKLRAIDFQARYADAVATGQPKPTPSGGGGGYDDGKGPRPDGAVLPAIRPEVWSDKEKRIHEQGLVSVLKQIHDELDAAVFEAYGWPSDLTDEQILERLVALNAERAAEEQRGLIRWLRPEFQKARAGGTPAGESPSDDADDASDDDAPAKRTAKGKRKAKSSDDAAEPPTKSKKAKAAKPKAAKVTKRPWPTTLAEQARAVREALTAESGTPLTPADLAKRFARGNADRIAEILDTLATLGQARRDGERYRAS